MKDRGITITASLGVGGAFLYPVYQNAMGDPINFLILTIGYGLIAVTVIVQLGSILAELQKFNSTIVDLLKNLERRGTN